MSWQAMASELRNQLLQGESENAALKQEIEQLKADKAALLGCVRWYTDLENWKLSQRARECIAKLGGTADES